MLLPVLVLGGPLLLLVLSVDLPDAPTYIRCPVLGQGKPCRFGDELLVCDPGFECDIATSSCIRPQRCLDTDPPNICTSIVDSTNLIPPPQYPNPLPPQIECRGNQCYYLCEEDSECPTFDDDRTLSFCDQSETCQMVCYNDTIFAPRGKCNVQGVKVDVLTGPMTSCDPLTNNCVQNTDSVQLVTACATLPEFSYAPFCAAECIADVDCVVYAPLFNATACVQNFNGPGSGGICARPCQFDVECDDDDDQSVQIGSRCIFMENASPPRRVCAYGCLPGQLVPTPFTPTVPPADTNPPPPPPFNPCLLQGRGVLGFSCLVDADCEEDLFCDALPITIWRAPLSFGVQRVCTKLCGGALGDTCSSPASFCDFGATNRCIRSCAPTADVGCDDQNDFTVDFCAAAVVNGVPRSACFFLCPAPTPAPLGPGFTVTPPATLVPVPPECAAAGTLTAGFQCGSDADCAAPLLCVAFFGGGLPVCTGFCSGAGVGDTQCEQTVQAGTRCNAEGICLPPCDFELFARQGCAQPSPVQPGVCVFGTMANSCVYPCGLGSECIEPGAPTQLQRTGYEACLTSAQCATGTFCGYSTCSRDCGTPQLGTQCPQPPAGSGYLLSCTSQQLCERVCTTPNDPNCVEDDPLRSAGCVLDELIGARICLGVCFSGTVNPPLLPDPEHLVSGCSLFRGGGIGRLCSNEVECGPGLQCIDTAYQGQPALPAIKSICTRPCSEQVDCFGLSYGYGEDVVCAQFSTLFFSYSVCMPQCDFERQALVTRRCIDGDPGSVELCGVYDTLQPPALDVVGVTSTCLKQCDQVLYPPPTPASALCSTPASGTVGRTCSGAAQCTPPLVCLPNFMGGASVCSLPCATNRDCPPSTTRTSYCHPTLSMCATSGLLNSNPALLDLPNGRCDDGSPDTLDFIVTDGVYIGCVNVCPGDPTPAPPPTTPPPPTTTPPPTAVPPTTTPPAATTGFVCEGAPDYSIGFAEDQPGLSACAAPLPSLLTPVVIGDVIGGIVVESTDSLLFDFVASAAPAGACARLLRQYVVSDLCSPGQRVVVIGRDEACNLSPGSLPVWANAREGFIFSWVDLDSDPFNAVPPQGTKSVLCDGQTNPQGSWRQVAAPIFTWQYELRGWIDAPPTPPGIAIQSAEFEVPGFAQGVQDTQVTVVLQGQLNCALLRRFLSWGCGEPFLLTPLLGGPSIPMQVLSPSNAVGEQITLRPVQLVAPGDYVLTACVSNSCNGTGGALQQTSNLTLLVPSPLCRLPNFPRPDGFACAPLVGEPSPCQSQCQRPPGICATPCDSVGDCPDPVVQICTGPGGVCVTPCVNATGSDCPLPVGADPSVIAVDCSTFEQTPFVSVCTYSCLDDQPFVESRVPVGLVLSAMAATFCFVALILFVFTAVTSLAESSGQRRRRRRPQGPLKGE